MAAEEASVAAAVAAAALEATVLLSDTDNDTDSDSDSDDGGSSGAAAATVDNPPATSPAAVAAAPPTGSSSSSKGSDGEDEDDDAIVSLLGRLTVGQDAGSPKLAAVPSSSAPPPPADCSSSSNGTATPPTLPLRDYQASIVSTVMQQLVAVRDGGSGGGSGVPAPNSALVYLPTGGGKTRIAADLCCRLRDAHGWRAAFVVNRVKLVDQAGAAFEGAGLGGQVDYIASGKPPPRAGADATVTVVSIQTFLRRYGSSTRSSSGSGGAGGGDGSSSGDDDKSGGGEKPPHVGDGATAADAADGKPLPPAVACIILDEAHGSFCVSYARLLRAFSVAAARSGTPPPFILGLTATPFRLDPEQKLSSFFKRLIAGPSIADLVARKVLVPPVVVPCDAGRLQQRAIIGGEPGAEPGSGAAGDAVLHAVVAAWQRACGGRLTIAFAADVSQSRRLVAAFTAAGVVAAHVDGGTPASEREATYAAFHRHDVRVLSSVGVLCEGFDEPAVAAVILVRDTFSKALYVQQVGRGLRAFPGKSDCIVLDVAGVVARHGPLEAVAAGVDDSWDAAGAAAAGGGTGDDSDAAAALMARLQVRDEGDDSEGDGSTGGEEEAASVQPRWTCKVAGCGTENALGTRACKTCGGVKKLSTSTMDWKKKAAQGYRGVRRGPAPMVAAAAAAAAEASRAYAASYVPSWGGATSRPQPAAGGGTTGGGRGAAPVQPALFVIPQKAASAPAAPAPTPTTTPPPAASPPPPPGRRRPAPCRRVQVRRRWCRLPTCGTRQHFMQRWHALAYPTSRWRWRATSGSAASWPAARRR